MWVQKHIQLAAKSRGFHLVTREIVSQLPELAEIETGLANVFIQHTSASLAINENADPDVRRDLESYFSCAVPENEPYFRHTLEGPDVRVIYGQNLHRVIYAHMDREEAA
ncbi:MAG: secondary thiamine-phosphate synthase enzyme YjbQ [Methylomonas sp.]